jgi:hypothetical protein
LDRLSSWRDITRLQRFAGTATYATHFTLAAEHFDWDVPLWLELGQVHEVARIWINDRLVGTAWHPPYRLEITDFARKGRNELRIEVSNILKNHLEAGTDSTRLSGLLGPVQVRSTARYFLGCYQ